MAYYTGTELRVDGLLRVAERGYGTAEALLNQRAQHLSRYDTFDIFLSHSFQDAALILGIATVLEAQGVRVYVDWLVDGTELQRSKISAATADRLRQRMKQCKSLVFATSASSPSSKWMPWELGYFDGLKGAGISIMPIEDGPGGTKGQEYLELYPAIEKLPSVGGGWVAAAVKADGSYMRLEEFAAGSTSFTTRWR